MTLLIAFHLTHQPNPKAIADRYGNSPLRTVINLQNQLFQLLLRQPITLSLRYLYDPHASADQRLQIFLIFNTELPSASEQEQLKSRLTSTLQSSEFYQIYPFQPIDLNTNQFPTLQKLDWVNAITEIQKAETISPKGYYLPRLFPENSDHDMVKICEQLSRVGQERFLLEITLQPYNNSSERTKSLNALEAILKANSKASNSAKDAILDTVIKSAENHQTNYSHNPLFAYSIKLLAEQEHSLSNLAISWLQNATNSEYSSQCHPPVLTRGSTEFQQSLQATLQVRVAPLSYQHSPALQNWHQEFGNQTVSKVFRGGGNSMFGDGSTTYSTSGSLVSGGSYGLSKATQGWTTSQPALMQDLLPLRHLVTLHEISSFLRVVIPDKKLTGMAIAQTSYPTMTAKEIFDEYKNEITRDTYIVGLNDEGKPVFSRWETIPHRLIAGTSRSGKTRFLWWLVAQLLYHSENIEVHIADFKGGVDFSIEQNVNLITDIEKLYELLSNLEIEIEKRKKILKDNKVVKFENLPATVQLKRIILIIDEENKMRSNAKGIKAPKNFHDNFILKLADLASLAAATGVNLVYAGQIPKGMPAQITVNLAERLVFRLPNNTDALGLLNGSPKVAGLKVGRAILEQQDQVIVNIPLISDEEWLTLCNSNNRIWSP